MWLAVFPSVVRTCDEAESVIVPTLEENAYVVLSVGVDGCGE